MLPFLTNMCALWANVVVGIIVGLATGFLTSYCVSRRFYRQQWIDRAWYILKSCCPYRRDEVRQGDGLAATGHDFIIVAEIMSRAGFNNESLIIRQISNEMEGLPSLSLPEKDSEKAARDKIKETWEKLIAGLY